MKNIFLALENANNRRQKERKERDKETYEDEGL